MRRRDDDLIKGGEERIDEHTASARDAGER
jgi:hypothetical protein